MLGIPGCPGALCAQRGSLATLADGLCRESACSLRLLFFKNSTRLVVLQACLVFS